jgi:hypothetical protein
MALIQLGSLVSGIKGSIGGTTFSQVRAGTTAKKRSVGKRLPNTNQANALNNSMLSTNAWNSLSLADKTAYNDYAIANTFTDRYGVVKVLTGFQWYKQLSQSSFYFTSSQLTSPPPYSVPAALPSFTVFAESDGLRIGWSTPIDTSSVYLYCYTSSLIRGNARKQRSAYRLTDIRTLDYSSFFNITDAWSAAHNLDWATVAASGLFNVSVLFYAVSKTSFNNGIAVFNTTALD